MQKDNSRQMPASLIVIGAALVLIGILLLSYNYVQSKRLIAYEYMDSLFYQEESVEEENENEKTEIETRTVEESIPKKISSSRKYQYIGYLEIPKIKLKRGFVDKDSKDNNVEKNLFITSNSTYPDVEKGNLIIAAHSGNSYKSFFKNLYKLAVGDTARVEYGGKNYIYQITKIYEQQKTGKIAIYRDYNKTALTLVTCTKDDDTKQTVYIFELVNIE